MKILKSILILLLVAIVGIIGFSLTIDGEFDSSATVEMNASPATVQSLVSDLTTWEEWGPWVKTDPTTKIEYSDPATGQDAWYTWAGDSIGSGKLTVLELTENSMATKVEFDGMDGGNGYWSFIETEKGTEVTWGMTGDIGMVGKIFMMIFQGTTDIDGAMDKMAGKDFVMGLDNLKEIAENAEYAEAASKITVEETIVTSVPYFSITETIAMADIDSVFFGRMFGELMGYMGEDGMTTMAGMPFAIYHVWDEENQSATIEVAIANTSELPETDRIKKGMTHEGNVLKAVKTGSYNTMDEHMGLGAYAEMNGKEIIGNPWEIFATDPTVDEIVVEVYYPVK